MKIIRKGDPNKLVGYKVICKECNCIYEIDLSETHPFNVMGNFVEREWRCPTCYAYQSTWQGGRNTCDPLYRTEMDENGDNWWKSFKKGLSLGDTGSGDDNETRD